MGALASEADDDEGYGSDAVDDTGMVSSQPTLAAGVEGRSGSIKEWKFQRWKGVGQEML